MMARNIRIAAHRGPSIRWHAVLEGDRLTWLVCSLLAVGLLGLAAFLPLWRMTLHAPQYPQGLQMTAFGTRLEGDIQEINSLNHYVGAQAVDPDSIRELDFFPYALIALLVTIVAGSVLARRRIHRLSLGFLVWAFALGFLVDLQWWLYKTGHNLSEDAPMRVDSFTPKVIGTTQVVNFRSETMIDVGFWLVIAAATILTVGPAVVKFVVESWRNTDNRNPAGTERQASHSGR